MFVIITRLYVYVPDKQFLQNALKIDRTFCYDITCRYTMLCSLFINNVDNLIKEPIMSKQKCQHVELSFNLVMTIGAESFEILDMIMQHLTHTKNNYLSPYKFLAINGNQNGLAENILTYQAQYNDITDVHLYIQKADFVFLIIDQLDKATHSILNKISLLNQNIILFIKPAQNYDEYQYLRSLENILKIYISERENKRNSALKMAHSVISIINLINKKSFTSVDFPDLHFMLSEQPYSYCGIAMRTDNQSVEELTKLALFDTQTNLKNAKYIIVLVSADSTFSMGELYTIWNIIEMQTNNHVNCFTSFDLVENSERRINYVGVLVAGY